MEEERLSVREWAQLVASRRRKVEGVCSECGNHFEGISTRKYCSNTCAARAYRKAHRAELNERRRHRYALERLKRMGRVS